MTLSEQLSEYVYHTSYDDLPADVVATSKRLISDTLASAWAGTTAPGIDDMCRLVAEEGGRPYATLWGFGGRTSASSAAFLNGVSAAALDFDCLHLGALAHSPIVILPATMALAERQRCSGKELLVAFTLGVELHCRLGMATVDHSGWFYTSMHGVLAAAAAGAKVLRLDRDGICNAIGAALAQCGGTQQAAIEQSLMKRTQSAIAARDGVFSALLAKYGMTAPRAAFEGRCGFYAMYESGDPMIVVNELGSRYEILQTTLKKFPSCGCNHAPIEAALQLMSENKITQDDIAEIEVSISPYMARLVGNEYDPSNNPLVAAQFSVQYSIASAIIRGRLGLAELEASAAREPVVLQLARSIKIIVDQTRAGAGLAGTVVFVTRAGERLAKTIVNFPGSPEAPLSDSEFLAKALECFSAGVAPLSGVQANALLNRVDAIEDVQDATTFFTGLAGVPASGLRSA